MNNQEYLVKEFIKHAVTAEQAQFSGDYRKGNKSQEALLAIHHQLKDEPELAENVFDELLLHQNPYVLYVASLYAVTLNYRKTDAIKILQEIAAMDLKLTSFHAEISLEMIESGELFELYGTKEKNEIKKDNKMDLLVEVHERIEEYADIGNLLKNPGIHTARDEVKLSEKELEALKAIEFSSDAIQGIEKIVNDRMFSLFFGFLAVLDGVGDPKLQSEEDVWLGFKLVAKNLEDTENEEFLHDQLFEAYSKWREIKVDKL